MTTTQSWCFLFSFPPTRRSSIVSPSTILGAALRKGLLVEAVDASYALGYVDIAMQVFYPSSASRSGEMLALLNRFALRASQHWFKHRRSKDLMSAKIYESVRRELSRRFRTYLYAQQARRANAVLTALVDYSAAA